MASKLEGGKSAAKLRQERETRVMDAIRLKKTDRVPIICGMGYFPAKNLGIPCSAAYYDYPAWYHAYQRTLTDYHAAFIFPQNFTPGRALEILDLHQTRWPGGGRWPIPRAAWAPRCWPASWASRTWRRRSRRSSRPAGSCGAGMPG